MLFNSVDKEINGFRCRSEFYRSQYLIDLLIKIKSRCMIWKIEIDLNLLKTVNQNIILTAIQLELNEHLWKKLSKEV